MHRVLNLPGVVLLLLAAEVTGVDYVREVKPLLEAHCYECHGASEQKGGLRLDTGAGLLRGGDHGKGLVPGRSGESLLIRVLRGESEEVERMPLKKPALSSGSIALLAAWIDAGASVPEAEREERAAASSHWAFKVPERPALPEVRDPSWARGAIDRFVLARLEREGIKPSEEADPVTLIRRVYLDLIGLPPSAEDVEVFVRDARPDAYERVVDRLLSSEHYGERWGRHWLDVARYADSNGYSIDGPRSIWRYRDWVVDALNGDMPFDRFTIEQLAGDLLPRATQSQLIATGFHRNTQINQEGGIDPEQFRVESIIDRVNTTGAAWLGLTVGCAQCHSHKFDPITQREYYEMFAFFNNCDEPTLELATEEELARRDEARRKVKELETEIKELGDDASEARRAKEAERERWRRLDRRFPTTMVVRERGEPRESYFFVKGDFTRHGDRVSPGVPAVLHGMAKGSEDRTRLDFARWLVDPANPLTARVTVNRIWQRYFGRGLVETENDFGTQGLPPSHPELLDWLATELILRGWHLKAMHRLVVTSSTYRQSSRTRDDLRDVDPGNRLLARQSRLRLDAEIVRDVALAASGMLSDKMGGPGVHPPQPSGVMGLGQVRRKWEADEGAERYRRGLYTFYWRATPYPALAVFDAPGSFSTCTRRIRSNTPLQALTLLNDEAFYEFAVALAKRVMREGPADDGGRIDYAMRLCLARDPSTEERDRLLGLLGEERRSLGEAEGELEAWTTVSRVLLNLDEMITRE